MYFLNTRDSDPPDYKRSVFSVYTFPFHYKVLTVCLPISGILLSEETNIDFLLGILFSNAMIMICCGSLAKES